MASPAWITMTRPIATMIPASGLSRGTRRISHRSTTAPSSAPAASAAASPSQYEPVADVTANATYTGATAIAACAKFTVRVAR